VVLPKHIKHPLSLQEKLALPFHENLLNRVHLSSLVIFRLFLNIFRFLLFLCCYFFEIIIQIVFAGSGFFFARDFISVKHDEHKVLDILEALLAKVVKERTHIVARSPYENDPIID